MLLASSLLEILIPLPAVVRPSVVSDLVCQRVWVRIHAKSLFQGAASIATHWFADTFSWRALLCKVIS